MLIDLQIHSTYSDGYLSPTELAENLKSHGIKAASLTDHNTVGGLVEFARACRKNGIKYIPGLELYVKMGSKKFNILWYNFDDGHPDLHKLLRGSQLRRRMAMRKFLEKLKTTGLNIDVYKILDKYSHYIPLNHVIDDIFSAPENRAIARKVIGKKIREEDIINTFFYNNNLGHLHETCVEIKDVLNLRKRVGGQIILNHPGKYDHLEKNFLIKLKELGVDGIEVLSPHHSIGAVMYSQYIANELKFITTGGSDFHKFEENGLIKCSCNYFKIDSGYLPGVKKVIG